MVGENERQRGPRDALWERFGVRILAYLICTPVLLLLVNVPIAVLAIVMFEDVYDVPSNMPSILGYALSQLVPLLIPVILVELRNRKRGRAVPLWICSLFVVTFSTVLTGTIVGVGLVSTGIAGTYHFLLGEAFTWLIAVGCLVAYVVSWALVRPFIHRFAGRKQSPGDVAGHF